MAIIYEIVNTITNKSYVGQTKKSLKQRLSYHRNEKSKKTPFYDGIKKYGSSEYHRKSFKLKCLN